MPIDLVAYTLTQLHTQPINTNPHILIHNDRKRLNTTSSAQKRTHTPASVQLPSNTSPRAGIRISRAQLTQDVSCLPRPTSAIQNFGIGFQAQG